MRKFLNRVHAVLTTAKSVAAGVGATITAASAGLAIALGAETPIVIAVIAVGSALSSFSTWEIPYKPFFIEEG